MDRIAEKDNYSGRARRLAAAALAASLLIAAQLYLIGSKGEAACLNEGCRIVEGLTRVSPFLFNLLGLLFFLAVGLAALPARSRPALLSWLRLLLLAAMAAEGVLLAYQYHVARAWCSYCLIIFALVALCNLMLGLRQFCSGLVLTGAVNIAFALLRFEPAVMIGTGGGLEAGTAAIRPGPPGGGSTFLIYANDCPHCMALLGNLPEFPGCTIRLNPVGEPPPAQIQGIARNSTFQPEVNRLLLRLLGIETVPVLISAGNGSYQLLRSQSDIEAYLAANCAAEAEAPPPHPQGEMPKTSPFPETQLFPPAGDEECRVDTECLPIPGLPSQNGR